MSTRQPSRRILLTSLIICCGTVFGQEVPLYVKKTTPYETYVAAMQQVGRLGPWHVAGPFDPKGPSPVVPGAVSFDRVPRDPSENAFPWRQCPVDLDYHTYRPWAYQGDEARKYVTSLFSAKADRPVRVYFCRFVSAPVAQKHNRRLDVGHRTQFTVYLNGKVILAESAKCVVGFGIDLRPGENELLVQMDVAPPYDPRLIFNCDTLQSKRQAAITLEQRIVGDFKDLPPLVLAEFCQLQRQIAEHREEARERRALLTSQVLRPDALIRDNDRDPLDIVLRRTRALLADLNRRPGTPDLSGQRARLAEIERARSSVSPAEKLWWDLFVEACTLRRRIALQNPLLDFKRIVFLKRHRSSYGHMCGQYYGFTAKPGGSVWVLDDPFSDRPQARDLLADAVVQNGRLKCKQLRAGAFLSLELSFDAKTLFFAWTQCATRNWEWTPDSTYHIFKASADGSGVTQMTDGAWNDFDPCLLPNGRIVFISERRGGFGRCHGDPMPTYTLHSMAGDGSDIVPLSYHVTNEWHPSVDHNGKLVYSRWDYVDRDNELQSFWTTYPDGRDPRSYHANYPVIREARPWIELAIRAVQGSRRYSAVASAHHGCEFGSLVLIDTAVRDDNAMAQVRRITPDVPFPEAEGSVFAWQFAAFGTPWPLSEDYYLCALAPNGPYGQQKGLYLIDSFGNRELIYADPAIECVDPIPLRPHQRPPIIPSMTRHALADRDGPVSMTGTIAVTNVYESDFDWPKGTKIAALRIVQVFPKTTPKALEPVIGAAHESLARGVVGTVPVEPDGSAHFEVRAGIPIYFQALDERGLAVQSMRSVTYVHPGERLICQGCHEDKWTAPRLVGRPAPMALRRPPSPIQPDAGGSWPLSYPRLVQPVLDRNCVQCHTERRTYGLSGRLSGTQPKSESFNLLAGRVWFCSGGNGGIQGPQNRGGGSRSIAGQIGARASSLFALLEKGHYDVKLSPEDLRRLTLWMDCNANFYGVYHELERQARGELVLPILE